MSTRFVFYSNEVGSLGHLRRTLAIAGRLAHSHPEATSLVLTGSMIEPFFPLPPRVDTVKLPARGRDHNGRQRSERLALDLHELDVLRGSVSLAATLVFQPDVVVVDQLPLGLGGELRPTLEALKKLGACRLVLGLRDIEDSRAQVQRKWGDVMRAAIEHYYDAVLVYGPDSSPDAIHCMGWGELDVPVAHVGYVGADMPKSGPADLEPGYLLATAGGGGDGFPMLASVAEAIRLAPLGCPTVLVTGPLMPAEHAQRIRELAEGADIRIFEFRNDMHRLIAGARAVVSMAGYNTVTEVMRARKPALFIPRVRPTEEQLVRAERLAQSGLQDMIHPNELSPGHMRAALERLLSRPAAIDVEEDGYAGTERAGAALAALLPSPMGTATGGLPAMANGNGRVSR